MAPGDHQPDQESMPVPVAIPGARARRGTADALLDVPGGCVAFHNSTNRFEARCGNNEHGHCRFSRTCLASKKDVSSGPLYGQGRPLGLLCSWLALSLNHGSKEEHHAAAKDINKAQRLSARTLLKQVPQCKSLLERERPLRDGEESEPKRWLEWSQNLEPQVHSCLNILCQW